MKKLFMILLGLVMCLGCFAASAQSEIPEDYVGYWELVGFKLMDTELSAEDLGRSGFAAVREDGIIFVSPKEGEFTSWWLHYTEGVCYVETVNGDVPLLIDDAGLLSFELESDGVNLAIYFTPDVAPELDAWLVPFVGKWEMEYITMSGETLTKEVMGEITATVYEDGYGVLIVDDNKLSFMLKADENGVIWLDNEGVADPAKINDKGQLCFDLIADDGTQMLVMNPVGTVTGASAQEQANTPAVLDETEGTYVVVTADSGKIRTEASISGGLIKTAYKGETYELIEVSGDWYVIDVDGRTGYLHTGVAEIQ